MEKESWRQVAWKDIESVNIESGAETELQILAQLVLKPAICHDSEPVLSAWHSYKILSNAWFLAGGGAGGRIYRLWWSGEWWVFTYLELQCDKVDRTDGVRKEVLDQTLLDVHESVHRDTTMKITNEMQLYRLIYYS